MRTLKRRPTGQARADPESKLSVLEPRSSGGSSARSGSVESPPRMQGRAEDVTDEVERELRQVRPRLARNILALLAATIAMHAALLATAKWTGVDAAQAGAVFNTTFTGLMTLAGAAVGFYFGESRGRPPSRKLGESDD